MSAPLPDAAPVAQPVPQRGRVLAVTSGSGGVGKTFLVANLAAALVRRGSRVAVLEADLGLANVDLLFGMEPVRTLHDVFEGTVGLDDAIVPAPGGVSVLTAGRGLLDQARLAPAADRQLVQAIDALAARHDVVLLHAGAGVSEVVQYTVSLATEVLVVVSPEPAAVTEAYAAIKLLAVGQGRALLHLVVNRIAKPGEGRAVNCQLKRVVDRFVATAAGVPVTLHFLGAVPADPTAHESLRRRCLVVEAFPDAPAARAIGAVARRLLT